MEDEFHPINLGSLRSVDDQLRPSALRPSEGLRNQQYDIVQAQPSQLQPRPSSLNVPALDSSQGRLGSQQFADSRSLRPICRVDDQLRPYASRTSERLWSQQSVRMGDTSATRSGSQSPIPNCSKTIAQQLQQAPLREANLFPLAPHGPHPMRNFAPDPFQSSQRGLMQQSDDLQPTNLLGIEELARISQLQSELGDCKSHILELKAELSRNSQFQSELFDCKILFLEMKDELARNRKFERDNRKSLTSAVKDGVYILMKELVENFKNDLTAWQATEKGKSVGGGRRSDPTAIPPAIKEVNLQDGKNKEEYLQRQRSLGAPDNATVLSDLPIQSTSSGSMFCFFKEKDSVGDESKGPVKTDAGKGLSAANTDMNKATTESDKQEEDNPDFYQDDNGNVIYNLFR